MRAFCEVDVTEDDPDEQLWVDEVFGLDEHFGFDDEFDFEDYIIEDVLEDDVNEDLLATEDECEQTISSECEDSEEGDISEEEDEQAQMVPMIAEAPIVLESCLRIEKVPGVCQVKTNSFRLCGDNIDKTVRRRFLRSDRGNVSLHYFHSFAIINRIDFSNLSDDLPDNSTVTDLENVALSLQPTKLDDKILQKNIGTLISRILSNNMNFFKVCLEDLINWHVEHKYTPEMSQKSKVVCFPHLLQV